MPGTVPKAFDPILVSSSSSQGLTKAAVVDDASSSTSLKVSAAPSGHPVAGVASQGAAQAVASAAPSAALAPTNTAAKMTALPAAGPIEPKPKSKGKKGKATRGKSEEPASQQDVALKQFVETSGHFSLVRNFHLADAFTLMNGFCGAQSLFASARYLITSDPIHAWHALWFPVFGAIFDLLDGKVARWRNSSSMLGQELDSLADSTSFGAAPAFAAFALGLRTPLDSVILTAFVCAGIARLARFNVTTASIPHDGTGKARYFEGLPIPSSLILVGGMAICMLAGRVAPGGLPLVLAKERGVGQEGFAFFGALRDLIPGANAGDGVPLGTIGYDLSAQVSKSLINFGLPRSAAVTLASYSKVELHVLSLVWLVWAALFISKTIRIPKP